LSDHIGRERTMFIAFLIEGFALLGLALLAHSPVWFVLFTGLVFFAWGRDLLAVSGGLRRYLREQIRRRKLRRA
jgi:hypothetical protein